MVANSKSKMISIIVKTPFDANLVFIWEDRKVKVKGDKNAMLYWDILKRGGLYGVYGHTLDMKNCFFRDLLVAISTKVKSENVTLSPEAKKQVDKEVEHERKNPLPKGAMT
jgi:hypothetical protein